MGKINIKLDQRSLYLRKLVLQALEGAGRGHIGPSLSLIEILRVLYDDFLSYRSEDPHWELRDRFILSKGHGCLALYALLADKGFFSKEELYRFCHKNAMLGGHPEKGKVPGVEASTGALGHGLSIGVGIALAARIKQKKFRTIVVLGDGELNEGSIWEALLACSKHKLSSLTIFIDKNDFQCNGPTSEVLDMSPLKNKFESFGFHTLETNGHDVFELQKVISKLPLSLNAPSAIICNTIKGKGIDFAENNVEWHYKHVITEVDVKNMYSSLSMAEENYA